MSEDELEIEKLTEFREALEKLVENPELFREVAEAVEKGDAERFQAALSKLNILEYCLWICRWFCIKIWRFSCEPLCPPEKEPIKPTVKEMLSFGKATVRLTANKEAFAALFDAYKRQDAKTFRSILTEWKMMPYCRQFCGWFAYFYCRRICWRLCPEPPVITHVGFIPTNQIDAQGYANGPSQPPGNTDVPDVTMGRGDHPFGGKANIQGVFGSIKNPKKYKVEYSSNLKTWTPITERIYQFCPGKPLWRDADTNGWYTVAEMCNMNHLTDWFTWKTPSKIGKYYLRLTVKSGGAELVSKNVAVRVDNEWPEVELQNLRIRMKDGTEKEIKCGGIKKGEGKIVIRFRATDPNFGRLTIRAEGGCGITRDIFSRSYDGNIADTGDPPWREVIWDPWADQVPPCCYLIVLRAWDRAIINNYFKEGHWLRDHEAVEVAL